VKQPQAQPLFLSLANFFHFTETNGDKERVPLHHHDVPLSRSFGFGFVENLARQFLTKIESFHVSFPLTA
jgi:hypothetical protein